MAIFHILNRYFSSLKIDADLIHGESFTKSRAVVDAIMKKLIWEGK